MAGVDVAQVRAALVRVARALEAHKDRLTGLDQAMGDGDLGITAGKMAAALSAYAADDPPTADVGTYLAQAGMAVNRAASSSLGTLLATAAMRAGKEARGVEGAKPADLARMLTAADAGIQERGKAKPGDKTIIDVLHPAAEAFAAAVAEGVDLAVAAGRMLDAARAGRDAVTPLRSRVGRASWVGERTEGLVDPGCEAGVVILEAIASTKEES
ncbi:MAG: DAK2 domain-containing protein [Trueperaceae bacterium]|nr:DAK2 domain-containing protein [Trueperaceae bacterium]